jgi:hypothetical protein
MTIKHSDKITGCPCAGTGEAAPTANERRRARRHKGRPQWLLLAGIAMELAGTPACRDQGWRGTGDACEVVTMLSAGSTGSEESRQRFFPGDSHSRLGVDIAGALSRTGAAELRVSGMPVATIERLYVAAVQGHGVAAETARSTFREYRVEILRSVALQTLAYAGEPELLAMRDAANACRGASAPR